MVKLVILNDATYMLMFSEPLFSVFFDFQNDDILNHLHCPSKMEGVWLVTS